MPLFFAIRANIRIGVLSHKILPYVLTCSLSKKSVNNSTMGKVPRRNKKGRKKIIAYTLAKPGYAKRTLLNQVCTDKPVYALPSTIIQVRNTAVAIETK